MVETLVSSERQLSDNDIEAIDQLRDVYDRLRQELGRVIVGHRDVIERLSICLFARGHALLMGVPGLAKTLLVSKVAETMSLRFSRIQFTPDLMPMDITGTDILQDGADGRRDFEFVHGPVFANIVLADEINRAPPKTQAAMLEAMQEYKVTALGKTMPLELPFLVLATQNPIEQEGTYPLPEAQLDRFMFLIEFDYPSEAEEIEIARTTTGDALPELKHLLTADQIIAHQSLVRRIPVPDHIYAVCRPARAPHAAQGPFRPVLAEAVGGMGGRASCRAESHSRRQSAGGAVGQLHGPPGGRPGGRGARADAPRDHHVRGPGRRDRRQRNRATIDGGNQHRSVTPALE